MDEDGGLIVWILVEIYVGAGPEGRLVELHAIILDWIRELMRVVIIEYTGLFVVEEVKTRQSVHQESILAVEHNSIASPGGVNVSIDMECSTLLVNIL